MSNKSFTILIVPEKCGKTKKIQIKKGTIKFIALLLLLLPTMIFALAFTSINAENKRNEINKLRKENTKLINKFSFISNKITSLEKESLKMYNLDEKLKNLTSLVDSERGLKIDSVLSGYDEMCEMNYLNEPFVLPPQEEDSAFKKLETFILNTRISNLSRETRKQITSLSNLVEYFSARKSLLSKTPSIWPTKGWVTSSFGARVDPYTGNKVMHLGIDIAAREGASIVAPAEGYVIYVGRRGAYGNMVAIDHGGGIVTHYGHISQTLVKIGDKIQRGQKIALVGNTGRSTGPHLHYEVRKNGLPVNPKKFILLD